MNRLEANLLSGSQVPHQVYLRGLRCTLPVLEGKVRFTREGRPPLILKGLFVKTTDGWHRAERNDLSLPLSILERISLEGA